MRIAAFFVLAALALTSCSGTSLSPGPDIAGSDLSKDVVYTVNRVAEENGVGRAHRATSADCEDVETIEKGAIADCTLTLGNGNDQSVRVTFQDDEGHFVVDQR